MSEREDARADPPGPVHNGDGASAEFADLRRLLVGPEQRRLAELAEQVEQIALTPDELADHLPEAIALRNARDQQIGRALAPTVQTALRESIRRNPREIATAIFPVLGPAIRKAIAEAMAGLVRSINSAVDHSLSPRGIRWRLESWRTGVPYPQIVLKHSLVYRVEQIFLIHADTGLLLAHVAAPDLPVANADLISAMLTAIQDFVRDSFRPGEGATLRTFSVGEHTVHVEAGPAAMLAAVVRGQAPDALLPRLQGALETIHLEFARQLADFSGDAAPFEPARPTLEECLETVLAENQPGASRLAWLRWAIPLAAIVVTLAALSIQSRIRWSRAAAALDAEPGIVVVDRDRGWNAWRFGGLKDPEARDPRVVIAEAGVQAPELTGRWERYLSLDSAIVVARARRALAIPAETQLTLRGDTLVVAGPVPLRSVAMADAGLPAGIGSIDRTGMRVMLPEPLDSLRRTIEAERILFEPGSAEPVGGWLERTRNLARTVKQLADGIAAAGGALRVELTGRTDPTGSDQTNQALSQIRVDRIIRELGAAGVPGDVVAGVAMAASRPLTDPDPAEQSRINRSVSFAVVVGPRTIRRP